MSLPSLSGSSSTATVRKPVFEVSFGRATPGGGLAAAAGSLVGGDSNPWAEHLVAVAVDLSVAPSVSCATLTLAAGEQSPAVVVDDEGTIALGYEDSDAELLFTGKVESVTWNLLGTVRITAVDGGALLSRFRVNQSYEQQKAGDIVKDLAGRARVSTDTVEDGLDCPFYVIDDRQSAYQHVATLARMSGYLASVSPDGKLNFAPATDGEPVQTFVYGEDILAIEVTERSAVFTGVQTVGEGAAGSQGQDGWSWLVKDPSSIKGTSGDAACERLIPDPTLRSQNATQGASDGILRAATALNVTGRILVAGAPAVIAASTIEITDAPQDELNGTCCVLAVRHRFSKHDGFTSLIHFSKTGNGGAAGSGGLL